MPAGAAFFFLVLALDFAFGLLLEAVFFLAVDARWVFFLACAGFDFEACVLDVLVL